MDTETLKLLNELQALRNSADPIRELIQPLPAAIQDMRHEIERVQEEQRELKNDVHGTKDEPSIRYQLARVQEKIVVYDAMHAAYEKTQRQVTELGNWKKEKEAAADAIKKTTIETIIKTAIPWFLFAVAAGYASYATLAQ